MSLHAAAAIGGHADTVPGAQLIRLQNGGDLIELEQEDQYLQIVSSFIDRHAK